MRGRDISTDFLAGLGLTAALVAIALVASGGDDLAPNTWVQVALTAVAGLAAVVVVLRPVRGGAWGAGTLAAFAALVALTYVSIAWSVQPANSWLEANRTLSYLAAFAAALALARLAPGRWRALVGAIAATAAVISAYALLVKVFPATFDPNDPLGRLRAPFDYWNAVGLMAAMGIPACLWAGARRAHAPVLRALSVPAISILLPALLLSYSRGAIVVAVAGTACWFALVPLRLRAALVLAVGGAGGVVVSAWALSKHSITADGVALSSRTGAGHHFGLVLLVVLAVMAVAGFAVAAAIDRVKLTPPARRRIGGILIGLVALVPLAGVAGLAESTRGLTGEVSHIWTTLTSTSGFVTDQPGRLVDLSNSRPLYWHEGLEVGEHHLLAGAGALGFATAYSATAAASHYASASHAHIGHAHSYVIETFADFGLIGIAVNLGLLFAWAIATGRTLGFRRPRPPTPLPADTGREREGLLTLLAVVVTFGVSSLIDWTWFIPGTAVPALVCAGWLAGRGPLQAPAEPAPRRQLLRSPGAALGVAGIAVAAILAIWVIVQPLRSADDSSAAITALTRGDTAAALTDARQATASDPVSIDPMFLLSEIYVGLGDGAAARGELVKATSLQPSNPVTWTQLGCYDLSHHASVSAETELARALALEPGVTQIRTAPGAFCASL